MTLDLSSFEKAIAALDEALAARKAEPGNGFILDSCIQRFEFTYELGWKMLRRHLENTEPAAESIDAMGFADLIRTGSERGLLRSGWDRWKVWREARNATSHTYDAEKALKVIAVVPDFLEEARFLRDALHRAQKRP